MGSSLEIQKRQRMCERETTLRASHEDVAVRYMDRSLKLTHNQVLCSEKFIQHPYLQSLDLLKNK